MKKLFKPIIISIFFYPINEFKVGCFSSINNKTSEHNIFVNIYQNWVQTDLIIYESQTFILFTLETYRILSTLVNTVFLLFAFSFIIKATRPVEAIFSFLIFMIILIFSFFNFEAEYVGSIHLIIYPGAILIFFVFATITTNQKGQWNFWNQTKISFKTNTFNIIFGISVSFFFWWNLDNNVFGYSHYVKHSKKDFFIESESITDIIAIGTEIFTRRWFILTVLGLILLLAFFISLELLITNYNSKQRSFIPIVFPRFGVFMPITINSIFMEKNVFTDFFIFYEINSNYLFYIIFIITIIFTCISQHQYAFLHNFLLIEMVGVIMNLFYTISSFISDNIDGDIFVLFNVAIAASETAIGLSLFIALTIKNSLNKKNFKINLKNV